MGNIPEVNDRLNSFVTLGAMSGAASFNILTEISSGPDDLDASRLAIWPATCSVEQR